MHTADGIMPMLREESIVPESSVDTLESKRPASGHTVRTADDLAALEAQIYGVAGSRHICQ